MGKLTNKVAFVTGSSKGIGKVTAKQLLEQGAKVVINGRNAEALAKTAEDLKQYGEHILQIAADVSDTEAFEAAMKKIIDTYGKLDILILNAGLSSFGAIEDTGDETLENVMKVNALGPFRGAKIALPYLKKTKGSVVFISSLAGLQGVPRSAVYSMSKMALTALAQTLKTEMTGTGVHVGIVYVGFTTNDPDKKAIGPDGTVRPIQDRPPWIQQKPEKVAGLILKTVKRRRFKRVLSPIGHVTAIGCRYFPRLWQMSMKGVLKSAEKLTAE